MPVERTASTLWAASSALELAFFRRRGDVFGAWGSSHEPRPSEQLVFLVLVVRLSRRHASLRRTCIGVFTTHMTSLLADTSFWGEVHPSHIAAK